MVRFLCKSFARKPVGLRRRADKSTMEDAAQQASLVHALVAEVQKECPIPEEDLNKSVIEVFENGDMNLELLLQGAIFEKDKNFKVTDVPQLAELMKVHAAGAIKRVLHGPPLAAAALEAEEFELFLKKADYDLQSHRVWVSQVTSHDSNLFFQKARYTSQRHEACKEAIKTLFTPGHVNCRIALFVYKPDTQANLGNLNEFVDWVCGACSLDSRADVVCLSVLNWVAPAGISSLAQRMQHELLGAITNSPGGVNVGCVLMPLFGYKKGMVWQATNNAQERLLDSNLNGDRPFGLVFDGHTDDRETRRPPTCLV